MKHLSSVVLAAAVVAGGAAACFKDPTSSLRNGASRIQLTRSSVFLNVGDSLGVAAEVKDDQGNTFPAADAVWTTSDAAIAVVNVDTSRSIPFNSLSRAYIRTTNAGKATVFFTSHGLTDSVVVVGVPLNFAGTITNATSNVGDTVTIAATAVVTFSTAAGALSEVTVGGNDVWYVSRTASQIKFIAPPSEAGSVVRITRLLLLGTIPLTGLNAATTMTVTEANEPANDDPATPTALTLYADKFGVVDADDVDDFFRFTTPATGDSVSFEISWQTDSDIDVLVLNATASDLWDCVIDGCSMASGSNPEAKSLRLAANTTYQILVEMYDVHSATTPVIFRIRTTKIQ